MYLWYDSRELKIKVTYAFTNESERSLKIGPTVSKIRRILFIDIDYISPELIKCLFHCWALIVYLGYISFIHISNPLPITSEGFETVGILCLLDLPCCIIYFNCTVVVIWLNLFNIGAILYDLDSFLWIYELDYS